MNDPDFLLQFENCTLPKENLTHKGHIRLAWLYLSKSSLTEASDAITTGIQKFAASIGASHIYNETLTLAWIYLVNDAMQKNNQDTFDKFILVNQYLLESTLPLQFYTKECLYSDAAKQHWVEPDLKPI